MGPGRGSRIDLRRALSRSLRTGGEITELPRRRRRTRPRPIVLLCDVSGSMELYTRTLLLFAHTLSRGTRDVEAFLFATRLTRITMALRAPKARCGDGRGVARGQGLVGRHAHRRGAAHLPSALAAPHAAQQLGRDPDFRRLGSRRPPLLRDEIARLHRSCHRLVWLNPLIGTVDYAPLTRGLQAALPFVDDFLPVRTLRDVRDLALQLARLRRARTRTSPISAAPR
jgi:uncharacterized protein with von Willebrand factor type A (vWA) domain